MFPILPDNVGNDRSIKNPSDNCSHIIRNSVSKKNILFKIIMIFRNIFKNLFFTLFKNSKLFAKLPENLETVRSMKNTKEFLKKTKKKFSQSKKFVDKNYMHFEKNSSLSFQTFFKLSDYLQTFQKSGTFQIHQKPMSSLSGKSVGYFRFCQTHYE